MPKTLLGVCVRPTDPSFTTGAMLCSATPDVYMAKEALLTNEIEVKLKPLAVDAANNDVFLP